MSHTFPTYPNSITNLTKLFSFLLQPPCSLAVVFFLKLDFVGTGNEADVAYDFIHQGRDILNDVYGGRSTNRINPGRGTNTTDLSSLMPIDETFAASTASTAGEQAANSAAHNGGKQRGQFQKLKKN